jgi:Trypsin-like peptidase domain
MVSLGNEWPTHALIDKIPVGSGPVMKGIARLLIAVSICTAFTPLPAATIPSDVKKTVTFIFLPDAQGNLLRDPKTNSPQPYGTGFFVTVKNTTGEGVYGYLVTARHVLRAPDGSNLARIFVRFDKQRGETEFVPIDLVREGKSVVYVHRDPTVDIAVIPCLPSQAVFDFKTIPEDMLSDKDSFKQLGIAEGTDVFFTGLFVSHYGDHRNDPIVRFGRVAMLPKDRIVWQENGKAPEEAELYLLETQSYGGNSGSPVFFYLGADRSPGSIAVGPPVIKLAGIMRGSFNENRAIGFVQPSAGSPIPISSQNIGISAVTPAYLLHEILFGDDLTQFRANHPINAVPAPVK